MKDTKHMKAKSWLLNLAGIAVAMHAGAAIAGESPVTARLGVSYRDFDGISYKDSGFRNAGQAGSVGPYGVQNVMTLPGNPVNAPVILDYVQTNGGTADVGSDNKFAPIIGLGYDLGQVGKVRFALVGNFQYYHLDVSSGAPGGLSLQQFQHWWLDTNADTIGDTVSPGVPLVGFLPGTTYSARNEFDMDMFVLDLGLEARTTFNVLNFTLAAGPSLTITDAKFSQQQQASWLAQGPGLPAGSYSQDVGESKNDFLPGAYGAVGVTLALSKSWTVGLTGRYDYVSGDAGTDQAKVDLSGPSAILDVAYRF